MGGKSIRRLYFLALYRQYEILREQLERRPAGLKHCPHFHKDFLEYKRASFSKIEPAPPPMGLKDPGRYPELALSLDTGSVFDAWSKNSSNWKELVDKALHTYTFNTLSEIKQLCETGQSDNYYKLENLKGYIKGKKSTFAPV